MGSAVGGPCNSRILLDEALQFSAPSNTIIALGLFGSTFVKRFFSFFDGAAAQYKLLVESSQNVSDTIPFNQTYRCAGLHILSTE